MFLLVKTKCFRYSFFNLGIEMFFLYLDRLLVKQKKYLVFFTIVIGFVLSNVFSISGILRIRDNYITARFAVKINRLLITSIWGYLVFILLNIIP
jgi:hypothetical protein